MISLQTLMKIAGFTGLVVGTTGYVMRWHIQSQLCETDSYKEALRYLYNHSKAVELLGKPINEGRIDIGNHHKYGNDGNRSWFVVPLKGSQTKGDLYVELWKNSENKPKINKVELTVDKLPGKVFVIKDDSSHSHST